MAKRRKNLAKPAAVSAMAAASLLGAPAASAQQECVECPPTGPGSAAFQKLASIGFPGNTGPVFLGDIKGESKDAKHEAFVKLTSIGFPGNTLAIFSKFIEIG